MGEWWASTARCSLTGALLLALALTACTSADDRIVAHMDRGDAFRAEGRYEKARVEYQNVLQIDPQHVGARLALAGALEHLERWSDAVRHYNRLLVQEPGHVEATIRHGTLLLAAGEPEGTLRAVSDALTGAPDHPVLLTLRGRALAATGDLEAAERDAERAFAIAPTHPDVATFMALGLDRRGMPRKAVDVLREAARANENQAALWTAVASLLTKVEAFDEAIEIVESLREREPDNHVHRTRLVALLVSAGRLDEAEAILRRAVSDHPGADTGLELVRFRLEHRGPEHAETSLGRLIDEQPEVDAYRFALARFYESRDQPARATPIYRTLIEQSGTDPEGLRARTLLARHLARQGDVEPAATLVDEVLGVNPGDAAALLLRAELGIDAGAHADAVIDLRTLLQSRPDDVRALMLLGRAHLASGEAELAGTAFARAIDLAPEDPRGYRGLARAEIARNQLDLARTTYIRGYKATGGAFVLLAELCDLYQRAGFPERAIAAYQAHIESHPSSLAAVNNLTMLLTARDEDPQALDRAEKLGRLLRDTDVPAYLDTVGWVHQRRGEHADALRFFRRAVERAPEVPVYHYHLALAYEGLGDLARAREHLERSLGPKRPFVGVSQARIMLERLAAN